MFRRPRRATARPRAAAQPPGDPPHGRARPRTRPEPSARFAAARQRPTTPFSESAESARSLDARDAQRSLGSRITLADHFTVTRRLQMLLEARARGHAVAFHGSGRTIERSAIAHASEAVLRARIAGVVQAVDTEL